MSQTKFSHEALLMKATVIGESIANSDYTRRYWQARGKMEINLRAQELFEDLKLKTNNKIGIEQAIGPNHPKIAELNKEIEVLEMQLAEIPVAMQYQEAQDELNAMMQDVIYVLMNQLSSEFPVEHGPRQGCGKGCTCGERD